MREVNVRRPEVRVRIKHTQTAKGWRCDETTVEVTQHGFDTSQLHQFDTSQLHQFIQSELYAAHQDGLDEANRRNAQEGRG